MKLSTESFAEPVFHILADGVYAAVLEKYPFPTPTFTITKQRTSSESIWKVEISFDIGFTEDMLNRTDVLEYMIQAQMFVDTSSIKTIRDTIHRLLLHWCKLFPSGVPDTVFDDTLICG